MQCGIGASSMAPQKRRARKKTKGIPSGNKTRAGADAFVERGLKARAPGLKPAGGNATTGEYPVPIAAPDAKETGVAETKRKKSRKSRKATPRIKKDTLVHQ